MTGLLVNLLIPPPFAMVAQVVLALILLIILISFLLGGEVGWRPILR